MNQISVLVTGLHDDLPESLEDGSTIVWRMVEVLEYVKLEISASERAILKKPYDWVLFTSRNAVRFWSELLLELDFDFPFETQVAAIGEATAKAAEMVGFTSDFYPTETGSEGFLREFEELLSNNSEKPRILIPQARNGRTLVADRILALGCQVETLAIYETRPRSQLSIEQTEFEVQDVILFTSPSSIDALLKNRSLGSKTRVLGLGPYTSKHLQSLGISHRVVPMGDMTRLGEVLWR